MEVKNTVPNYMNMNERQIMMQRTYVNLQKSLLKKNEKDNKERRGMVDGRTLC